MKYFWHHGQQDKVPADFKVEDLSSEEEEDEGKMSVNCDGVDW